MVRDLTIKTVYFSNGNILYDNLGAYYYLYIDSYGSVIHQALEHHKKISQMRFYLSFEKSYKYRKVLKHSSNEILQIRLSFSFFDTEERETQSHFKESHLESLLEPSI